MSWWIRLKLFVCVSACVQPRQLEAAATWVWRDCRATVSVWINNSSGFFILLPFFRSVTHWEYMHQGALLFSARCPIGQRPPYFTPQPLLSCPLAILQLLLYLPHCAVDEMETSCRRESGSSGYLPQDVFTVEQPKRPKEQTEHKVLQRLNKAADKGKCWRRLRECEQSGAVDTQWSTTIYEKHFSNRPQTLLTFILGAKTAIPLVTCPPPLLPSPHHLFAAVDAVYISKLFAGWVWNCSYLSLPL